MLLELKERCVFFQWAAGIHWSLDWAKWRTLKRQMLPCFYGATDFWHCARVMCKSNTKKNWQPTSEVPLKSRTHSQIGCQKKRSTIYRLPGQGKHKGKEVLWHFLQHWLVTALAGQWMVAPECVLLTNESCPPGRRCLPGKEHNTH